MLFDSANGKADLVHLPPSRFAGVSNPLPRRTSPGEQLTRPPRTGRWVAARSIGRLRLFGLRFTRCDCRVRQVACRSTSLRRPVCIEWRQVIE